VKDSQVAAVRVEAPADTRSWARWLRLWPGALLVAVTVWFTAAAGVPVASIGLYAVAFVWSVIVPGVLVHRALRGRPSTLVSDLALGGATGLVLQLFAWALFTALHVQAWLVLWPLAVVVPFVAVPGLRRHFSLAAHARTVPTLAAWLGVIAYLLPFSRLAVDLFGSTDLPPAAAAWYQDDLWHLALSAELMRTVPPDIPQLAGQTFFYHWFSNAHIAAMTWTTGLDLPVVFARLWMPAILALAIGVIFAVGEQLANRPWAGAVAALLMGAQAAIWPSWFSLLGFTPFGLHSPSQVFSLPIIGLVLAVLIQGLRDERFPRGAWVVLALALVGAPGAKSSALPVIVSGILLALLVALLVRRGLLRRLLGLLGLALGVLAVTSLLTAGASAGVTLQLFSTVRATQPWVLTMGTSFPFSKALVLPGLDRSGAVVLLVLLLLSWVVGYSWVLPGLRALTRRDLSGWLLLGVGLGGWAAMMLLSQDGLSQAYFMSGAVVALYPLAAWGLALAWDAARSHSGPRQALLAAAVGAGLSVPLLMLARYLSGPVPAASGVNGSLSRALVVPALVGLVALGAALLARQPRYAAGAALVFLAVSAGVVTAGIVMSDVPGAGPPVQAAVHGCLVVAGLLVALVAVTVALWPRLGEGLSRQVLVTASSVLLGVTVLGLVAMESRLLAEQVLAGPAATATRVSAGEVAAARWLQRNSEPDDVIATNVHCLQKKTVPLCDARAYWVTAFTQRRALLEGWAYTTAAHEKHGVGGRPYSRQPFSDRQLFALNEAAFRAPTQEILGALYDKGVRWLFADTAAGPVSPSLADLADLAHESGTVQIYRLRSPQ
jgi:hypothetical protein